MSSAEPPYGPRGQADFVGHARIPASGVRDGVPINNLIASAKTRRGVWVEEATSLVGPTRAEFRSTYIRWSLAINGLHVAATRYQSAEWRATHAAFYVTSIRVNQDGDPDIVRIAQWDGTTAAKNHLDTIAMLLAYGVIDLYACLEEWVFAVYRTFLNAHPDSLIKGDDFRELRRLRRDASSSAEAQAAWESAWRQRLEDWQRRRIYDGLDRVFVAFASTVGLKRPVSYTKTDIPIWAESIRLIAVLRNSLVHGAEVVNAELASLCSKPHSIGFEFKEGEPLLLKLPHLQAVECFLDQLLTAVNLSLFEHPDAFQ